MSVRKAVFWLHLIAGISAGIVVMIMSLTGVLLAYEKQVVSWIDRDLRAEAAPSASASRLPLGTLLSIARDSADGATPTSVAFYADSAAAAVTTSGPIVYLNSYDGRVIGTGSVATREFFRKVTEWHRYVSLAGDNRPTGKAITGAANLVFLFIIVSGCCLWLRGAVTWFRKGLRGKALYWNWHNVFGVWALVPLFAVVLSATVISYPWVSNLVYKLAGSPPPAANEGRRAERGGRSQAPSFEAIEFEGADFAIAHAGIHVSDWRTITMRVPMSPDSPLSLIVDSGSGGQPQLRSTLTVDRTSGKPRIEKFGEQDLGRRARSWLRFVHTGEYYGLIGQTIAAIASFAAVMLVWTGFALSLMRFLSWRRVRSSQSSGFETIVRKVY